MNSQKQINRGTKKILLCTTCLALICSAAPAAAAENPNNYQISNAQLNEAQRKEIQQLAELAEAQGEYDIADHFYDRLNGYSDRGIAGWARKAAVWALRHYGDKLPAKIRPWAGKVAGVLDQAGAWERFAIMNQLVWNGVPLNVAEAVATWID